MPRTSFEYSDYSSSSDVESEDSDGSDDEFILKIDINNAASHQTIYTAKRTTSSNFHGRLTYVPKYLDIVASTLYRDDTEVKLHIITKSQKEITDEQRSKIHERWVHLETDSTRFEDFERLVINIVLQHHDQLVPVVMYLLRKVHDDYEKSSAYGSYIEPGTALRCDGMDRNNRDTPDLSAIFVSLPYLDIGKWRPPNAPKDESLHLTRGLFQSSYPQETPTGRDGGTDGDQMFRDFKGVGPDEYLRVPQLWALILDSKVIITCGPSDSFDAFEEKIDFVDEASLRSQGPSLVKVTDAQKRIIYLPIERCGTFLELRKSIENESLGEATMDPDRLVFHLEDSKEELKANEWPGILKSQRSVIVSLRMSFRGHQAIEGPPDDSNLIEYGALSSDDEDDNGNDMALIIRENDRSRIPSRKADASVRKLNSQGYVVNKTASLHPTSSGELERKPKIFKRPSKIDLETDTFDNTEDAPLPASSPPPESEADPSTPQELISQHRHLDHGVAWSMKSLREGSEDEKYTDDENEIPIHERIEELDTDSLHRSVISDSNNHLSANNQAGVDDPIMDDTADPKVKNEGRTSSELPQDTRAETIQPTVESDTEEPSESEDKNARPRRYIEGNASSHLDDVNETMGNDKPPSVQSKDEIRESGDHQDRTNAVDSEANSLEQVIKDIKEELAAMKKDNEEARLEAEMRKRLAGFGFQENQIQAMLNTGKQGPIPFGEPPVNPLRQRQPTFPKVHKQYLDIETLLYYDIPYQYDPNDPDYILIQREMDHRETDVLFEHTRRLRARTDSELFMEGGAGKKQDYSWVRRKIPNSRKKSSRIRNEGFTIPTKKSSGVVPDKPQPRLNPEPSHKFVPVMESMSGHPPPTDDKDIKANLKVPPFLAWPSTIPSENDDTTIGAQGSGSAPHRNEEDLTQRTLATITKYIVKLKTDSGEIPVGSWHPFMRRYRSGRVFLKVPELTFINLTSKTGVFTTGASSPKNDPHPALLDIKDELAFFQKLLRRDAPSDQQPTTAGVAGDPAEGKEKVPANTPRRRVIQWQLSTLLSERDSFLSAAQRLIDQFVPNYYPDPLLRKCWGSLDAISEAIMDLCTENEVHRKQETSKDASLIYVIKAPRFPDYLAKNELEDLDLSLLECPTCSRNTQYPDIDDAYKHLNHFHDHKTGAVTTAQRHRLSHWLVSTRGLEIEDKNAEMLKLMQALHRRTSKLLVKAVEIRNSVANEDDEKDPKYLLPSALVKAAMKIFQFLYTALYAVQYLRDYASLPAWTTSSMEMQDNLALADYYGMAADRQLSKAQDELLLMAHTGSRDGAKVIEYKPSPPEETVLLILIFLCTRKIHDERAIEDLYRSHLSTLRYNAIKNPSKRIFRSLFLLEEELSLVSTLHTLQHRTLRTLTHLTNPSTHRLTTHARLHSYSELESPTYAAYLILHRARARNLHTLTSQLNKTAQVLRYNLEIAEEGQSKAILVFTIVTIVFLPLSFVAGLFGMNTADIREIGYDQRVFWAVALPTTAVIGGVSLVVAFGDVGARAERVGRWWKRRGRGGGGGGGVKVVGKGERRRRGRHVEDGEESEGGVREEVVGLERKGARRATFVQVMPASGRQARRKGVGGGLETRRRGEGVTEVFY